jgi:hypothetical protein
MASSSILSDKSSARESVPLTSHNSDDSDLVEQHLLAITGDFSYFEAGDRKTEIKEFLNAKDLLPSVDINDVYMRNKTTMLLSLDEDIQDEQLAAINKALGAFKCGYSMQKYTQYLEAEGLADCSGASDEDAEVNVEVADNYRRPRAAVHRRRGGERRSSTNSNQDNSDSEDVDINSLIEVIDSDL